MNIFDPYIQNGLSVRSAVAQKAYHNSIGLGLQLGSREGHMTLPNAGKVVITETPEGQRTPEEIQAQLEARYAEMEAEAERMAKAALTACRDCRWCSRDSFWGNNPRWQKYDRCGNPLVVGFDVLPKNVKFTDQNLTLCGPEKALWEPKLTRWQKFMEWMHRIIDRLEAPLALTSGKG